MIGEALLTTLGIVNVYLQIVFGVVAWNLARGKQFGKFTHADASEQTRLAKRKHAASVERKRQLLPQR